MPKKDKRQDKAKDFDSLDGIFYYDEYISLERTNPRLAQELASLIKSGKTAEAVAQHVIDSHPHRWPQSRIILGACRYLESQLDPCIWEAS